MKITKNTDTTGINSSAGPNIWLQPTSVNRADTAEFSDRNMLFYFMMQVDYYITTLS